MLKECRVVVEDILCDTQEINDIHSENQNNIKGNPNSHGILN